MVPRDRSNAKIDVRKVRLSMRKSSIDQKFQEMDRFLVHTKSYFQDEAERIFHRLEEMNDGGIEFSIEEYDLNNKVFPRMFMTSWIISTFCKFEHELVSLVELASEVQKKNLENHNTSSKILRAKDNIKKNLQLKIDDDLFEKMEYYRLFRNHLVHQGREISQGDKGYDEIQQNDFVIYIRIRNTDKERIVIARQFGHEMCHDLLQLLNAIADASSKQLPPLAPSKK